MRTNSVVCMHACMYDGKCIHLYVVFLCLLLICLIFIRSFYLNIELFYANAVATSYLYAFHQHSGMP